MLLGLTLGGGGGGDDTAPTSDDLSSAVVHDMAQSSSSVDMTSACVNAGPKAFGTTCTTDCECASGMCRMFQMGAVHLCTQPCTQGCPNPPSTGGCTPNGYCKF